MNIPEGRAIYNGSSWQYEFDYKDHLGNTRVSFKADGSTLVQTAKTDTDPWGVVLKGTGLENSFQNRFEFQGKESEKTFGLNRVNFGARSYNPTIGRFDRTDRFSEKYYNLSTYQYTANNPVNSIEINGDSIIVFKNGRYSKTINDGRSEIIGLGQSVKYDTKGRELIYDSFKFSFNDYENDREGIKSGDLKLRIVKDSEIFRVIQESGVLNQKNPWRYIERESRPIGDDGLLSSGKSSGKMDYQNYTQRNFNSLNIIDGVAYNNPDFGNFLWGHGGKQLGFSLYTLKFAAHLNNIFNSKRNNPNLPYSFLDSPEDQQAIKAGYNYKIKTQK